MVIETHLLPFVAGSVMGPCEQMIICCQVYDREHSAASVKCAMFSLVNIYYNVYDYSSFLKCIL